MLPPSDCTASWASVTPVPTITSASSAMTKDSSTVSSTSAVNVRLWATPRWKSRTRCWATNVPINVTTSVTTATPAITRPASGAFNTMDGSRFLGSGTGSETGSEPR